MACDSAENIHFHMHDSYAALQMTNEQEEREKKTVVITTTRGLFSWWLHSWENKF